MFPLIVKVLNVLILLEFTSPSQECRHCLKFEGIQVSVTEFDVNDSFSLLIP